MACTLKQPSILAEGHISDDIEKLIGFILHGVTHMLHDNDSIMETYLVTSNENINIIDPRGLPKELVKDAVTLYATQNDGDLIAYLSEAWMLPDHMHEAQQNGTSGYATIEDHPDKFEVLLITIESAEGVWLIHTPFEYTNGKRSLPETIKVELMEFPMLPYPDFNNLLPVKVPAGVSLH